MKSELIRIICYFLMFNYYFFLFCVLSLVGHIQQKNIHLTLKVTKLKCKYIQIPQWLNFFYLKCAYHFCWISQTDHAWSFSVHPKRANKILGNSTSLKTYWNNLSFLNFSFRERNIIYSCYCEITWIYLRVWPQRFT